MASYYKVSAPEDSLPQYRGFHVRKVKQFRGSPPRIKYDFSRHVLIELLDNSTPESRLWAELGLSNSKMVVHKRMMADSHRIECRRAVVVCVSPFEAKKLTERLSQTKIMNRCVCAVVVKDLLSDLCLFEKQIVQFGDRRPQHQFVYVTDLNRCREPTGLVKFLKKTFSPFGTILSVLVCPGGDGYAQPEGVIRFAYLSEAFAAELALDHFVVGKERLSVTSHHNILLSQCDLRVRLREAQWKNNGTEQLGSPDSYCLNNLSAFDESSVVHSINGLNICETDNGVVSNNLSVSCPREVKNLSDDPCQNLNDGGHADNALGKSQSYKSAVDSKREMDMCNDNRFNCSDKYTLTKSTDCRNAATQMSLVNYSDCRNFGAGRDASNSESFVSCLADPKFSAEMSLTCVLSDDRNAESEYYSILSLSRSTTTAHRGSKPKKRKHYTPSQKLCLKSQRVGFSQQGVRSGVPRSGSSQSETSTQKVSKDLNVLPEEPGQSRVTSWLSSQPTSMMESQDADDKLSNENPVFSVQKGRISVHDTPALSSKNAWNHSFSDSSSLENNDPNIPPDENWDVLTHGDTYRSPLQAWLKEELASSVNNVATQSRETSKSVIVCAARNRDFIISVGCSHMTCDFCYPDSTDLLLGFS